MFIDTCSNSSENIIGYSLLSFKHANSYIFQIKFVLNFQWNEIS